MSMPVQQLKSAKRIEDMSAEEIMEHLEQRKTSILRRLKSKWQLEAEHEGVKFGAVMLYIE